MHVFNNAQLASEVWNFFFAVFGLKKVSFTCISSLLMHWFITSPIFDNSHVRIMAPIVILWCLWLAWNEGRFHGTKILAAKVLYAVDILFKH